VSGSNISKKKLLLGACLGLGLLSLGFIYVKWPQSRPVPADPAQQVAYTPKKFDDLPSLMRAGLQNEYDFLITTVPARASLEGRKLDSISTSAGRMDNLVREMAAYERDLKAAGKSSEDVKFFHDQVLQLDRATQDLQEAALRRNLDKIGESFNLLEKSCSDCHSRFGVKTPIGSSEKQAAGAQPAKSPLRTRNK